MDNAELMQKEIENKRKLPEEIKKEIKKNILFNLLVATIIVLYLFSINMLFLNFEKTIFENQMKFLALGLITITVIFFEIAYRKQSKRTCIIGIELLLCSIYSLYVPYIYLYANVNLKMITTILPIGIAIYYIFKDYIIYKTRKFKHQNNLSDVREILSYSEKESYLDEESSKLYRKQLEFEEETKKELIEEQKRRAKLEKEKKNKSAEKVKTQNNSKRKSKSESKSSSNSKKKVTKKISTTEKEESIKKKTSTKKTTTKKTSSKNK